jgi:DNA-binding response OmpR family regulator
VRSTTSPSRSGWLSWSPRIQTHLRFAASQRGPADGSLVIDDLVVDRARRRVHLGDDEISLRPKEFDVLERLAIDAGRVVTRE